MKLFHIIIFIFLLTIAAAAQSAAFTYQGRLSDTAPPQGGSYLLKFELFDAATGGASVGVLTDVPANVVNGVFTVELNFTAANAFDGGERFLEISVRRNASENYVLLTPRQKINAAPYAVRALVANDALQIGGTPAANIIREGDSRLTDSRQPAAGSGDYIQNQNSSAQTSANFMISGAGAANIFNAASEFQIGGSRVFRVPGNANTYVGVSAGAAHTAGAEFNSFFGRGAGFANSIGDRNAYFGENAGRNGAAGVSNSFFGTGAGALNAASDNSFFGADAGANNASGNLNVFVGRAAGLSNQTGANNTLLGAEAGHSNVAGANNTLLGRAAGFNLNGGNRNTFVGSNAAVANTAGNDNTAVGANTLIAAELSFATAIGAGASVSNSNSIVLGRSADAVSVPGSLNVNGSFGANIVNTANGFQIGGNRVLFAGSNGRTFAGFRAGLNTTGGFNSFFGENTGVGNTSGSHNAFFGSYSGENNTTGMNNAFFGADAGKFNVTGSNNAQFGFWAGFASKADENSFFGAQAGYQNTTGTRNVFVGRSAGAANVTGSNNTFLGTGADATANNLNFAAAVGAGATVSADNTIVLGRNTGEDTVQIPGSLNIAGAWSANIVNASTQFNLNGRRILSGSTSNIFAGADSGASNSTGSENSFFGRRSGVVNLSGRDNTFIGREAGGANTTGNGNTFVGVSAGFGSAAGSNNTAIGINANINGSNLQFATAVGANSEVTDSNTVVLGRSDDAVRIPGRLFVQNVPSGDRRNMQWDVDTGQLFQDTSSRRYKENIRPLAVDFRRILQAVPQTYTRPGFANHPEIGFIAEDLDALGLKPLVEYDAQGRPDGVNYDKIPLYLTRVAAEQQSEIERLREENNRLKTQFAELQKLVCAMQPTAAICQPQDGEPK